MLGFWPGWNSNFMVPTTLVAIKYWSSDCIVIWSVCTLCSSSRSFISRFQICDPTDICCVAGRKGQILSKINGFSIATQRILVGSQIWDREVKVPLELLPLCTDHVTIRSDLNYLIGGKAAMLKCWVFVVKTGPFRMGRFFMWEDPLPWSGTDRGIWTRCEHYSCTSSIRYYNILYSPEALSIPVAIHKL